MAAGVRSKSVLPRVGNFVLSAQKPMFGVFLEMGSSIAACVYKMLLN